MIIQCHTIPSAKQALKAFKLALASHCPSEFLFHEATSHSELKGAVVSIPAFLFKQSSPEVVETDTVKVTIRHFWVF